MLLSALAGLFVAAQASGAPLTLQTLHAFGVNAHPAAELSRATDGNFYGTTVGGGTKGDNGTVYRITPAGVVTVLYSFGGDDGSIPAAGLVQGTDGLLYGTTQFGGLGDFGTIYRISTSGQFMSLRAFSGTDGSSPQATLTQGTDGNFYGTTRTGGTGANGTIFRITPAGAFTTLYSFPANGRMGRFPAGRLVQASDGHFYGTTAAGGATTENGTIFRITIAGQFNSLASFNGANGSGPAAGMIQSTDGNLYGTTETGGLTDNGTVFRSTTAGAVASLFSFTGANGNFPRAPLVRGTDGNFYGTTSGDRTFGGTNTFGTVFRITPAGALSNLIIFNGMNGSTPVAGLTLTAEGQFYGTTFEGGPTGGGTVFRLVEGPVITSITPIGGSVIITWTSDPGRVYRVEYNGASLNPGGWIPLSPDITAVSTLTSFTHNLGGATVRFFRIRLL
ncbi:MAG: hypothetical protein L0Y58_06315 [Verrucomicrobia subdivision 3 bacterium]|nr:hypothetical protein [Limisphaerales bacterium]